MKKTMLAITALALAAFVVYQNRSIDPAPKVAVKASEPTKAPVQEVNHASMTDAEPLVVSAPVINARFAFTP